MDDSRRIAQARGRLLDKLEVQELGCWHFTGGSCPKTGYGRFVLKLHGWKTQLAHRASYRIFVGAIPDGLCIDHLCRNRICVNPHHMRITTTKDNVLCGIGISAMNAVKTHCDHGHIFDEKNTYFYPDGPHAGERVCRMCGKLRMRKYRNARKIREVQTEVA